MVVLPALDTFTDGDRTVFIVVNPENLNAERQEGRLKMTFRERPVEIVSIGEAAKNMVAVQVGQASMAFPLQGTIFADKVQNG